jgi:hypothetical protein
MGDEDDSKQESRSAMDDIYTLPDNLKVSASS